MNNLYKSCCPHGRRSHRSDPPTRCVADDDGLGPCLAHTNHSRQSKTDCIQVVVQGPISWRDGTDLNQYLESDRAEGMIYGQPLVRYSFIQEATGKRFFFCTAHHSIYDGWSMQLLFRQVAAIYVDGIVPKAVPYTPFIRYLSQGSPDSASQYWRQELRIDNEMPTNFTPLPHARYQPQPSQRVQRRFKLHLEPNVLQLASTSNILRATWALAVAQYAAANDVIFAVSLSGRTAPVPGIADMVAPTLTTVPVRVHIDPTKGVHHSSVPCSGRRST
jgi:hypothetical protein